MPECCDTRLTRPAGPTARANSSVGAPQPQPTSNIRSPVRGAAKASKASVSGVNVVSVCAWRAHFRRGFFRAAFRRAGVWSFR